MTGFWRAGLLLGGAMLASAGGGARAATLVTLHSFGHAIRSGDDASTPYAGLVRDPSGKLYGTSYGGGAAGAGAVYELSPPAPGQTAWTETIIHSFAMPGATDGANPVSALIAGADGVLYGTTSSGGGPGNAGGGTVFALTRPGFGGTQWDATILAAFPLVHGVSSAPVGRLLQDRNGAIFGTTMAGGTGLGSVFKLTPPVTGRGPWTNVTLHDFSGQALDGEAPLSGLAADASGAIYGTTEDTSGRNGSGTVYRLTPPASGQGAWSEQVLFNFPANGMYGARPNGDLVIGQDGKLYGTAVTGGGKGGGDVFRLTRPGNGNAPWSCAVLYNFTGHFGDAGPEGGIIFGPGDTLIGTTGDALKHQQGTVFQLFPGTDAHQSWTEQILARFPALPRGGGLFPVGDLVAVDDGAFMGVTELGGEAGAGTVFSVKP